MFAFVGIIFFLPFPVHSAAHCSGLCRYICEQERSLLARCFNKPFCYRILPIYPSGRRALFGGLLIYWRYWCDKKPSGHPSSACQSRWEDGILSSTPIILPTPPERTDESGWGRCEAIFRKSLTKCKAPRSKKNEKKNTKTHFVEKT